MCRVSSQHSGNYNFLFISSFVPSLKIPAEEVTPNPNNNKVPPRNLAYQLKPFSGEL